MNPPQPLRVLYVEDDDDLRSVFGLMLSSNGFDVTAVGSAEEALEQLSKRGFAAMLTDYSLPRRNADWLLREARTRGLLAQVRVIILSAEQQPSGVDGYAYVRKPGDIDTVGALLRNAPAEHAKAGPGLETFARIAFVTCARHSRAVIRSLASHISSFDERQSGSETHNHAFT